MKEFEYDDNEDLYDDDGNRCALSLQEVLDLLQ